MAKEWIINGIRVKLKKACRTLDLDRVKTALRRQASRAKRAKRAAAAVALLLCGGLCAFAQEAGQAPAAEPGGVTFGGVIAVLGGIIIAARAIVLMTPTPKDNEVLEKIISVLKKIGLHIGCMVLAAALLFTGCASFSTTQKDLSFYETGTPQRQITTRATARTFFESKSALSNFKANQTDKTQSANVGQLSQEASATNAVSAIEVAVKAAVEAAVKAVKP